MFIQVEVTITYEDLHWNWRMYHYTWWVFHSSFHEGRTNKAMCQKLDDVSASSMRSRHLIFDWKFATSYQKTLCGSWLTVVKQLSGHVDRQSDLKQKWLFHGQACLVVKTVNRIIWRAFPWILLALSQISCLCNRVSFQWTGLLWWAVFRKCRVF